jgi:dTDP-4-dehydrorhamnose reductase
LAKRSSVEDVKENVSMKIAVTGAAGLFGRGLVQLFSERTEVVSLTRADADITDAKRMRDLLISLKPDVVVHPAGIPDVDYCELHPEEAFRTNADATRDLVAIAKEIDAAFAFISTDAVFDGKSERPYVESDPVNPPSVYGRTKVAAEEYVRKYERHWIFRVSVLFGPGKANFVSKGVTQAMAGKMCVVASDQLGSALYTIDGARTMLDVFGSGKFGTFHLCNQGACTREELARKSFELAGMDSSLVVGKSMSEMRRPGPRLQYAVMEMRALRENEIQLPRTWEEALGDYVKTLNLCV